jgi:hypothetical protein
VPGQAQHRGALEAIEAGDAVRAAQLAREHAEMSQGNVQLVLADQATVEGYQALRCFAPTRTWLHRDALAR